MADLATIEGTPLNVKECWEIGDSLERLFVFRIFEIHEKNLKILIGNNSKEELNNFNASSK